MYAATVTPVSRGRRPSIVGPLHQLAGYTDHIVARDPVTACGLTLPRFSSLVGDPEDVRANVKCGNCFAQ